MSDELNKEKKEGGDLEVIDLGDNVDEENIKLSGNKYDLSKSKFKVVDGNPK